MMIVRTLYTLATRTFDFRNDYDLVLQVEELYDPQTRLSWNSGVGELLRYLNM